MLDLQTARLRLSRPGSEDAESMVLYATRNREHFAPWEPLRQEAYFESEFWSAEIVRRSKLMAAGHSLFLILRDLDDGENRVLGHITFNNIVRGAFQAAHLGYALDSEAVGNGYMREALREAIDHVFADLGLHRIMANYMPTNHRSASVLKALGFVPEGFARDYLYLAGAWQDHVLTALTNTKWQSA
ncbi:MAG: GNAT family N-acetyltransferase [Myxococcales bacterium]|nr:GNAT family N-acetyltransferase [Myxococcales bacterium]